MNADNLEDLRRQFNEAREASNWDLAAGLSQRIIELEQESNSLPHAAGLLGGNPRSTPGKRMWLDNAWDRVVQYAEAKDIDLKGSLDATIEEEAILDEDVVKYKTVLAGYYLIAVGDASDLVVNDVHALLVEGMNLLRAHYLRTKAVDIETLEGIGDEDEMKDWYQELNSAAVDLKNAKTRTDKVLVIDKVMHIFHVDTTLFCEMFVTFMTDAADAAYALVQALSE